MSKSESLGLKAFAMAGVFACHCFDFVNYWGFLFVSVFFFVSGYGLADKRKDVLFRLPRLFLFWAFYLVLYGLVTGRFTYQLPHFWFLPVYCLVLLFWRFSDGVLTLFLLCCLAALSFYFLDFNFVYWSSLIAFPFGVFVRRYGMPKLFYPGFFLIGFLAVVFGIPGRWFMLLGFLGVIFSFRRRLLLLCDLGFFSQHFYFIHYLFLYVCGVQIAPNSLSVPFVLALPLSCVLSLTFGFLFSRFFSVAFWRK